MGSGKSKPAAAEEVTQQRPGSTKSVVGKKGSAKNLTGSSKSVTGGSKKDVTAKQGSKKDVAGSLKQVAKKSDSDESGRSTPDAKPLDPKDPENQKIKNESGDKTPFWKKGPSEFRPTSSRPMSTSGKLLVYKTEKQKQMEEQARANRAASGDMFSAPTSRPGSSLPPLADRKKLSMQAKQLTSDVRASNGGAAWAMEL